MRVTILEIDLTKRIFQLLGVDEHGKVALRRRGSRSELRETVAKLPSRVSLGEKRGGAGVGAGFSAAGAHGQTHQPLTRKTLHESIAIDTPEDLKRAWNSI